jgi:hypothetical protein
MTKKLETAVYYIDYKCGACGCDVSKAFLSKEDMETSPLVVNNMCTLCLVALPLPEWKRVDSPTTERRGRPKKVKEIPPNNEPR